MVANSDLQRWENTVKSINETGKQYLTQEEWSALIVLNDNLNNGDFSSDESRRCIKLLKNNLSRHSNNRILQTHLHNFITLCEQYFNIGTIVPTTGNTSKQSVNTNGNTSNKGGNSIRAIIAIAVVLFVGYALAKNNKWFNNLFSSEQITDKGVIINGIKWATRNVDEVGTFVPNKESLGKFYQWNRKKAFPNSMNPNTLDAEPKWDDYNPSGIKWEKVNDPSPAGWRVPTYDEIASLLDKDKVTNKLYIQNDVLGVLFTDKTTSNTLFIPIQSYFDKNSGLYYINPSKYWSNAQFATYANTVDDNSCHSLFMPGQTNAVRYDNLDNINYDVRITHYNEKYSNNNLKTYINSIRCVEDIPPPSEVLINGVRWATCNVDDFGTFASSSRAIGKLYQWNRKKAWAPVVHQVYSDYYTEWNNTYPSGTIWEETNDPSPTGWRVPTKEEIESLLDENKVSRKRFYEGNGHYGLYDFQGVLFTDKATGNTLRLPLTGDISSGGQYSAPSQGYYWSSTAYYKYGTEQSAYSLIFMKDGDLYGKVVGLNVIECYARDRRNGYAIRSVRK